VALQSLAVIAVTAFALYLPWILYQKFYDPPGDALLKFHLAGEAKLDHRTFLETLETAYRNLGVRAAVDYKLQNFKRVVWIDSAYWQSMGNLLKEMLPRRAQSSGGIGETASDLRVAGFFNFGPCMGFLMIGPLAFFIGTITSRQSREWKVGAILWLLVGFTLAAWCLLMFSPGGILIHQGTYVAVLLMFAASVLSIWALSPWFGMLVVMLQIALNVLLYVTFVREPVPGKLLLQQNIYGTLPMCVISLAAVFVLLGSMIHGSYLQERGTAKTNH